MQRPEVRRSYNVSDYEKKYRIDSGNFMSFTGNAV